MDLSFLKISGNTRLWRRCHVLEVTLQVRHVAEGPHSASHSHTSFQVFSFLFVGYLVLLLLSRAKAGFKGLLMCLLQKP